MSKNEIIPIKFLRVFNKDGFILKSGVYSESELLVTYLGVEPEQIFLRICGGLISGGITNLGSDRADNYAKLYYEEIHHRTDDVKKISIRLGVDINDVVKIRNYLFMETHYLNGEVKLFDPDFAIAQSWQRLSDINMVVEPHDLTLIRHELLEMQYMSSGLSQNDAHKKASEVYNYDEEVKCYYDKIKRDKV